MIRMNLFQPPGWRLPWVSFRPFGHELTLFV
jgi:hypothetical protein